MDKIDFKKSLDSYQAKQGEFKVIDVPKRQYVIVDGCGDPNVSQEYKDAISVLYPLSYALKFASKQSLGKDYVVMPLEGLWWARDMESFTTARDKSQWSFTAMIMQPDWITVEMFANAVQNVSKKNPALDMSKVRLEVLDEGLCVQTLHIGSFDDETPVLEMLHSEFIPTNSLEMTKKHHEIYLSDFRKVEPSRLRTILRQPVRRVT